MNSLMIEGIVKILLVLTLVTTVFILSRRDIYSLFRTYASQSILIAAISLFLFFEEKNVVLLFVAILTLLSKGVFIPWILQRAAKSMNVHRDVDFHYLQPSGSIIASISLIILVHMIFSKLLAGFALNSLFFIGAVLGVSLTFMGMLIVFSRRKIISKIVGYLAMENGVVLFSLFLSELPLIIEVFVLMDLIMMVILVAILAFGIDSSVEEFHTKLNPFRSWFDEDGEQ
jgi:hydrogenase-4 component E